MYNFRDIMNKNLEKTEFACSEDFDIEPSETTLGFSFFNPNPRGSVTGDCVKRAIVVATGMDYKELELFMNRNKVDKSAPYNNQKNYENVIKLLGGKCIKMSVPAGTNRWHVNTINDIMHYYPHISYVLQVSKHLIGVREETIFDLFDDRGRDKGIYKMFLFGATESEIKEIQQQCSKGYPKRFIL